MDMNNVNANDVRYCPSCNAANKSTSKFCMICGAMFPAEAPVVEETAAPAFGTAPAADTTASAFGTAPAADTTAPAFGTAPAADMTAPAFGTAPAAEQPAAEKKVAAPKPAVSKPEPEDEEPKPVFANGLPKWDIVPPDTMVRRKQV